IASAQSLVGTVQAELMLFQRELADVGRTLNIALPDLAVGRAVWDTWFDGLLFGAMPVQERIRMSHTVLEDAVVRMREQLLELRTQQTRLTSKIDELTRERAALLDPARG
ncbi:MAG TPA: hypothetical protein VM513_08220, partial [Kofleriaceae bacterium]|nr:hypothetical protein [Kofleriaceae bacterium]